MTMRLKSMGAALALAIVANTAAADYRGEVTAIYADLDDGDKASLISGTFHFNNVKTDSHPLAEAAFLERSNNVMLMRGKTEYRNHVDVTSSYAVAEFYIPQAMLYVAPVYFYSDYNYEIGRRTSVNDWGAYVGLTLAEGLRISTLWMDDADYEFNLQMKYVVDVSASNTINVELDYVKAEDSDEDDAIGVALDFYFDRTFSVGLELGYEEDASFGIRTQKFFTEQFSVLAGFRSYDEYDVWQIGAALRF
jgi:hypothetical protein